MEDKRHSRGNRIKALAALLASVLIITGAAAVLLGMSPYVPEKPDAAEVERVYPGGTGYVLNAAYAEDSNVSEDPDIDIAENKAAPRTEEKPEPEETRTTEERASEKNGKSGDTASKSSGKTDTKKSAKKSKKTSSDKQKNNKDKKKDDKIKKTEITVATDLSDGETVESTVRSFFVEAKDPEGNEITAFDVTVTVNGEVISSIGFDGGKITYKAPLEKGQNTIVITVRDESGNEKTVSREIISTGGEPQKIGTVTISTRADTLSLGTVIPKISVDIYEGEQLSHAVDRYLKEAGVDYSSKGSLDSGFYLSGISKSGIASGAEVPEKLAAVLEEHSVTVGSGDKDSLKQKDYTSYSGWVVCVDGKYITTGMSGVSIKPGSKIELVYTLYNGSDVDGSLKW